MRRQNRLTTMVAVFVFAASAALVSVLHFAAVHFLAWRMFLSLDVADDGPLPVFYTYEKVLRVIGGPIVWFGQGYAGNLVASIGNSLLVGAVGGILFVIAWELFSILANNQAVAKAPAKSVNGDRDKY